VFGLVLPSNILLGMPSAIYTFCVHTFCVHTSHSALDRLVGMLQKFRLTAKEVEVLPEINKVPREER